jgi:hypothetical protein
MLEARWEKQWEEYRVLQIGLIHLMVGPEPWQSDSGKLLAKRWRIVITAEGAAAVAGEWSESEALIEHRGRCVLCLNDDREYRNRSTGHQDTPHGVGQAEAR